MQEREAAEGRQKSERVKHFRSALSNVENAFLPYKQPQPAKEISNTALCLGADNCYVSEYSVRTRSLTRRLAACVPIVCKCPLYGSLFVQEEQECGNQSV